MSIDIEKLKKNLCEDPDYMLNLQNKWKNEELKKQFKKEQTARFFRKYSHKIESIIEKIEARTHDNTKNYYSKRDFWDDLLSSVIWEFGNPLCKTQKEYYSVDLEVESAKYLGNYYCIYHIGGNLIKKLSGETIELITASAIWYLELNPLEGQIFKNPTNIDSGLVVIGHRHSDIILNVSNLIGKRSVKTGPDSIGEYKQGFITNTYRFVNRIEALEIAAKAKQINHDNELVQLHSEDLW